MALCRAAQEHVPRRREAIPTPFQQLLSQRSSRAVRLRDKRKIDDRMVVTTLQEGKKKRSEVLGLMALESWLLLSLPPSVYLTLCLFLHFQSPCPSHQENQMEAVWKTDVASSSHPIEKKTPPSLLWDQLGGYPDIPRLLALDVHSSFQKSLRSLKG